MAKYEDLGNPTVTLYIGSTKSPNDLVDLVTTINVRTIETVKKLGHIKLKQTPMVLELADRSTIRPKGILDDLVVSIDSWEYLMEFLVLWPKSQLGGNPLIFGRPWLATTNAYISCRS